MRAVNETKDNDTVAAIVGAAVGALHEESAPPARWREGLLGRTRTDDDGHVQALIDEGSSGSGRRESRDSQRGFARQSPNKLLIY